MCCPKSIYHLPTNPGAIKSLKLSSQCSLGLKFVLNSKPVRLLNWQMYNNSVSISRELDPFRKRESSGLCVCLHFTNPVRIGTVFLMHFCRGGVRALGGELCNIRIIQCPRCIYVKSETWGGDLCTWTKKTTTLISEQVCKLRKIIPESTPFPLNYIKSMWENVATGDVRKEQSKMKELQTVSQQLL